MKIVNVDAMIDLHEEISWCEFCDKTGEKLDCHHIYARGMGGGSRLDIPINLIILCRTCHDKAQNGRISRRELWGIAAEREVWKLLRS